MCAVQAANSLFCSVLFTATVAQDTSAGSNNALVAAALSASKAIVSDPSALATSISKVVIALGVLGTVPVPRQADISVLQPVSSSTSSTTKEPDFWKDTTTGEFVAVIIAATSLVVLVVICLRVKSVMASYRTELTEGKEATA